MILFVFEGEKREPKLLDTIRSCFLPKETDAFVCTYRSNIYSLYSKLKQLNVFGDIDAGNTVSILNDILSAKGDDTLNGITVSEVSQIYLFFDYDFHDTRLTLKENNEHVNELLDYFDDETNNGRLLINYPMVESIYYTKQLPDPEYSNYTICRNDCAKFKQLTQQFSHYNSLDHLCLSDKCQTAERTKSIRDNWIHLVGMNTSKANYLCNNKVAIPANVDIINQRSIYKNQLIKYVNQDVCCVAILNAFPIFIYEYIGSNIFED